MAGDKLNIWKMNKDTEKIIRTIYNPDISGKTRRTKMSTTCRTMK
jgi:hypothetical protein